ncbi:MAG TPA: diaminopimelate decarboxylase, partial [Ferruginibacter sp.]|nr:diaminopimelate decarboxylase [Ferruginibacter sp.]
MAVHLSEAFLRQLAEEYGTPLYVYQADRIRHQYQKLAKAFRFTDTRIYYACKALSNVNILRFVQSLGAGLDCVSIHEVKLGLLAGFQPTDLLFTPNCVDFAEILEATELGVNINIDNISILEQFGHRFGNSYPVCIRLNPHILAGGNAKISTGHIDSKFGISIHQLRHIERIVQS